MKKIVFLVFFHLLVYDFSIVRSQVAINSNGSNPDISAMLDVSSDTAGVLIPRMTKTQRNDIASPATGLIIYQTDDMPGFYFNSGTPGSPSWEMVGSKAGYWKEDGSDNIHYNKGMVGIGTSTPSGKLNIMGGVDTLGLKLSLPSINQLPDPSYTHKAAITWEGGETKFGKWRNYFNGWEQDWALSYNVPWDYTTNAWGGRDSGHPYANIAACMRFNIAEGNSGLNVFEIAFAPPGEAGSLPDFNAAAHYYFFNGRVSPYPSKPARFAITGAADMDAMISLHANNTYDPVQVDLISVGSNPSPKLFKIRNASSGTDLLSIKVTTGNVGIGTIEPDKRLHIVSGGPDGGLVIERSAAGENARIQFKNEEGTDQSAIVYQGTSDDLSFEVQGLSDVLRLKNNGNVGIGTDSPGAKLDINGTTGYEQLRMRTAYTPTGTSDSNGDTGDIAWDDSYIYIKTSAGWKRAVLSEW